MKILIRELKKLDVQEVGRIYSEIIQPSYISYGEIAEGLAINTKKFSSTAVKDFEKYISRGIGLKTRITYVALAEQAVVGFMCVRIQKASAGHKECWIDDIGVGIKFRRLGVAKKLVHQADLFGKKNKSGYFFLESGYTNKSAHTFFEKEGFKPLNIVFIK